MTVSTTQRVTIYSSEYDEETGRVASKEVTIAVTLVKGDDRYNVLVNGQKIGWVCRPRKLLHGGGGMRHPEGRWGNDAHWSAYTIRPEEFRGTLRSYTDTRRDAVEDVVFRQRYDHPAVRDAVLSARAAA